MLDTLTDGDPEYSCHFVLAHGAGAPMDSAFMTLMANLLAERRLCVHRFEFAYMAARRKGGSRKPPPRAEALMDEYRNAVSEIAARLGARNQLLIGGKSMGGRVASLVAGELFEAGAVSGLVCLGYPFHPTGDNTKLRKGHLEALACPALVVQGERDPFGNREEIGGYALSDRIAIHWAHDGDHDFGPRGGQGTTRKENLNAAADAIAAFAAGLPVKRCGGAREPLVRERRT